MTWTIFDRYVFKNLLISTLLICAVLTLLVMVVQSIRFLELVMNSGASMVAFGSLLTLSIPRFVEAVLPISLMISILFFYNKIIMDSEMVIMRSAGASKLALMKPALVLSGIFMVIMFIVAAWVTPKSISEIQLLRQDIRGQYASLLFREGIFNTVGSGLTAYVRHRDGEGVLHGLMIHDTREEANGGNAYTVVAQRGVSLSDSKGQKVIVYDGTRHELDEERRTLSRLDFKQYTIDIPERKSDISSRWKEPDERSLPNLLNISGVSKADQEHIPQFIAEANRRISLPFLILAFCLLSGAFLLTGQTDRKGLGQRILGASLCALLLQGLYLAVFNLTKQHIWVNTLLYVLPIGVSLVTFYILSPYYEARRLSVASSTQKGRKA